MATATLTETTTAPAPPSATDRPATPAELAEAEARRYRAWGTEPGETFARAMGRLAQLLEWTGATTADEHDARMEAWDEEVRRRWEAEGRDSAPKACAQCGGPID